MVLLQERYIFRLTNTKNTHSSGYLITSKTGFFFFFTQSKIITTTNYTTIIL